MRPVETLRGPAGRLEAVLNFGRIPDPPAAVLLCHPHPLYGGTLHNKVVYHAMKALTALGLPVLRFNFRGAGASAGTHDNGRGEQDDVRAGLDWLHAEWGLPMLAAGFSFGAHMALRAGCPDPRVRAIASLGTPIRAADRAYSYDFLFSCAKPKLFLSGSLDPFGPETVLREALAHAPEPKCIAFVPEAEHFFQGHLPAMQEVLSAWITEQCFKDSSGAARGVEP